jgi:hypothetical protein
MTPSRGRLTHRVATHPVLTGWTRRMITGLNGISVPSSCRRYRAHYCLRWCPKERPRFNRLSVKKGCKKPTPRRAGLRTANVSFLNAPA